MKFIAMVLSFLSLASCQLSKPFEKTVESLDLRSFMGTWYVQAGRFTPFETDVYNSIERYTWNEKKEIIEIDFTYNQGGPDGTLKEIPQTGRIYNEKTNAHWKVSPFWPLQFDFLVLAIGENKDWTAIGVPSQKYLWIMSRSRDFSDEQLKSAVERLDQIGYDTNDLTFVSHEK